MTAKQCSVCGVSSTIEQGFITKRSLTKKTVVCVTCHTFQQNLQIQNGFKHQIINLIIGFTILLFFDTKVWFFINFFLLYFVSFFGIILHELGHALGALITGNKIIAINFGRGRTLLSKKLFNIYLDINLIPVGGLLIYSINSFSFFRLKVFITILFGPLANLLVAWLLWEYINQNALWGTFNKEPAFLLLLFLSNTCMGLVNLIPFISNSAIGYHWSDGGNLLFIPFLTKKNLIPYQKGIILSQLRVAQKHNDFEVMKRIASESLMKFPDDLQLKNYLGVSLSALGDYTQARSIFMELVEAEMTTEIEHAIFLNNVADANYLIGDPELLSEALEFSEEAYSLVSWDLSVRSTRGSVLIENNQLEEGIKILRDKRNEMQSNVSFAQIKCALAIAYAKQGKLVKAKKIMLEAMKLDNNCCLLSRVEEALLNQNYKI